MEIADDTDWYDAWLDTLFQEIPLSIHYGTSYPNLRATADLFLTRYDTCFGLLGGRGPGNGVANVHMGTIRGNRGVLRRELSWRIASGTSGSLHSDRGVIDR